MATKDRKPEETGKAKPPIKKFTIGFEVEFLIIDKEGKPAPGADAILEKAAESGGANHAIVKECAENLIEVGSYPDPEGSNTMKSLLAGLKLLTYAADQAGYFALPMGTYPGKFTPIMRKDLKYRAQEKVFGKTRFQIAGRVAGYHCHYALPWGVFDAKSLTLKGLSDSRNQENLVNAFNFLIAMDPALSAFMQSSPFYQGRHIAKDSRLLAYRGGEALDYPKGLYANLPFFGSLPDYVHTGADIMGRVTERHDTWLKILRAAGVTEKQMPEYRSVLETNWSGVKVNPHGTLEARGMDMSRLPILFSVSMLIQVILRHIQEGNIDVVPHDSAIASPFSLEDGKVYIAPETHVKKRLQRLSAYEGLASDEVYEYCRRLVNLAKALEGEKIEPLLAPLSLMLSERKTTADYMLAQAKAAGYKGKRTLLPAGIAADLALSQAKQLFEDIVLLEQMIDTQARLSEGS